MAATKKAQTFWLYTAEGKILGPIRAKSARIAAQKGSLVYDYKGEPIIYVDTFVKKREIVR